MTELLPLFVQLKAKYCLVAGGGKIGLHKCGELLALGAKVTLWSPSCAPNYEGLQAQYPEQLSLVRAKLDLPQAEELFAAQSAPWLFFACTAHSATNAALCALAEKHHIWANNASSPQSSLQLGAVLRRGSLSLAINCQGAPALSTQLKQDLAQFLPPCWSEAVRQYKELRLSDSFQQLTSAQRYALLRELAAELCAAEGDFPRAYASWQQKQKQTTMTPASAARAAVPAETITASPPAAIQLDSLADFWREEQLPPCQTSTWAGGTSSELLLLPLGANSSARNFDLRLSTALISQATSTFSDWSGYRRLLLPLNNTLELRDLTSQRCYQLQPYACHAFAGSTPYASSGLGRDFNVIYRPHLEPQLAVLRPNSSLKLDLSPGTLFVLFSSVDQVLELQLGGQEQEQVQEGEQRQEQKQELRPGRERKQEHSAPQQSWQTLSLAALSVRAFWIQKPLQLELQVGLAEQTALAVKTTLAPPAAADADPTPAAPNTEPEPLIVLSCPYPG